MNHLPLTRPVFFISDRTGLTAEKLGRSLLTQFAQLRFEYHSLAFINSKDKAHAAANAIKQAEINTQCQPLIFSTLINDDFRTIISNTHAHVIDFFDTFIKPLEVKLDTSSSHTTGLSHGIGNEISYMSRMDAVNFTLKNDDGISTKEYKDADIILIGVSRSGKTPTCLYLAMQFGLRTANYPLTESDLAHDYLPKTLQPFRKKLFGLLINAERLCTIRNIRKQDSEYASFSQCQKETKMIKSLFDVEKIPHIDTSHISVEEIATSIIQIMKIGRPLIY